MPHDDHTRPIEPGQPVMVDYFRPQDAPGVAALFRQVYGEDYPVKLYYHPRELAAAVEAGEIIQAVARTPGGEVVGVESMYHSAPFKGVFEVGAGLVLVSYRNRGVNKLLLDHILDVAVPRMKVPLVWGEPVCNHVFQQKSMCARGFSDVAMEVDLMPAAAYGKEKSAAGRVSALVDFKEYIHQAQSVCLPRRYQEQLREIYGWSGLERAFLPSDPLAEPSCATRLTTQVFDYARVGRVAVEEVGKDLDASLDSLEAGLLAKKVTVIQTWLKLASPLVEMAVEALRARGFFFGGLLPRWFDQDGLLMQKLFHRPDWEAAQIFSEQGKRLFHMVRRDWESLPA